MGNLCSRSANEPDPFSRPGRRLNSSAATSNQAPSRAPVPADADLRGPGRTLSGNLPSGPVDHSQARSNAAEAAQKRAVTQNASGRGKLSSQLAAQKLQTRTQTLNEASRAERAARDADQGIHVSRWD